MVGLNSTNVDERIQAFMKRKNVDLTKDVRFKRLRTIKWHQFAAEPKSKLMNGFYL